MQCDTLLSKQELNSLTAEITENAEEELGGLWLSLRAEDVLGIDPLFEGDPVGRPYPDVQNSGLRYTSERRSAAPGLTRIIVSDEISGREPRLSSQYLLPESTGMEPMLGGERLARLTREAALDRLERKNISHLKRQAIGYYLAEVGDTRPGVGLREDGLPDLAWCAVPRGEVHLGDSAEPFAVDKFWIAKYPVTWQQYRIFLEAPDGHFFPQWWEGLRWRAEYQRAVTPAENYPAQEVSWYDAMAYVRWLNDRFDTQVRLPSEWEWQQAATGGDPANVYPWGERWQPLRANTRESGLRGVTAVGMYPQGASPVGALDMCGTVLEWCANEFYTPKNNWSTGEAHRVMRGGSWFLTTGFARTTSRTGDNPYYRFNSVGFRLATDQPPEAIP